MKTQKNALNAIALSDLLDLERNAKKVFENQIPFCITEENKGNINPTCAKHAGKNASHDATQNTYERKENYVAGNVILTYRQTITSEGGKKFVVSEKPIQNKTLTQKTESYASKVESLAKRFAETHIRQAKMECSHLRGEFIFEIKSAIGAFLAVRISRFPTLARDLLTRFACDALPVSTVRALHRYCRVTCDDRMRRMSAKSKTLTPSAFTMFSTENIERSEEVDTVFINARIDYLLGLVRARGSLGGCARAAQAHTKLLEQARGYLLASVVGNDVEVPSAGLVKGRLTNSALYMKILRLARFVRESGIISALGQMTAR